MGAPKNMSRRNLIGGAGAALAASAFASTALANEGITSINYADTVVWNAEYDLVVVGFGGAGGMASVVAADEGAKVLLVEKAPFGGGNTALCEQVIFNFETETAGQEFMHAMFAGFDDQTDEIIDYIIDGSMRNSEYLKQYLGAVEGIVKPERAFSEYVNDMPCLAEGTAYIGSVDGGIINDKRVWQLVKNGVESRADNITVLFNTPATHLIQDPFSKTILGLTIEREGVPQNVRAKKGVILACGSYEANLDMWEQFRQMPNVYPLGSMYNTGDGIKMGLEVGADLWHMAAISGPWLSAKNPDANQCYFTNQYGCNFTAAGSSLVVGPAGTRFVNENAMPNHGHISYGGTFMSQVVPDLIYVVFDQPAYDSGLSNHKPMSMLPESIFLKADTIDELVDLMGIDKDGFLDQLSRYNEYAAAGYDPQFGRPAEGMAPVETGPFYAVELHGSCVNAQGGPRRNTKCQVVDPNGNPIPHLYSAGELGGFWAGLYIAGGNIAECIYTGHDAALNALQESEEIPATELTAVDSYPQDFANDLAVPNTASAIELGENEYLGWGIGMNGDIVAKVTVVDGTIQDIEVVSQMETPDRASKVWDRVPQAMIEANTVEVDSVAGATVSSIGLAQAVADALAQANA